jgi:four helix bundle protein
VAGDQWSVTIGEIMKVKSYADLQVWQKSMMLVTDIYKITADFPKQEIYGLTTQIRKSAVSIPSNIAEGSARETTRDLIRFINIAYGYLAEMETQLLIAKNIDYLAEEKLFPLMQRCREIGRMLNGLRQSLLSSLEEKATDWPLTTDH